MSGLPWIKVLIEFPAHPKIQRLEKAIGVKDALGIVVRLWCWTATYHPDGMVPEAEAQTLVKVAWGDLKPARNAPRLLEELASAGWVDRLDSAYRVHDWAEVQAAHVERIERLKENNRQRQARYRNRHYSNAPLNALRNVIVTPESRVEESRVDKQQQAAAKVTPPSTPPAATPLTPPEGAVEPGPPPASGNSTAPPVVGLPTPVELDHRDYPNLCRLAGDLGMLPLPRERERKAALEKRIADLSYDQVLAVCRADADEAAGRGEKARAMGFFEKLILGAQPKTGPPTKPQATAPAAPAGYFGKETRRVTI